MPTRLAGPIAALALTCSVITPGVALARPQATTHVIKQMTSKKGLSLYVKARLKQGHRYRFEIASEGHTHMVAVGFENYFFNSGNHLISNTKGIQLSGGTPYQHVIVQPSTRRLTEWDLAIEVQVSPRRAFTVRLRDMGKTH